MEHLATDQLSLAAAVAGLVVILIAVLTFRALRSRRRLALPFETDRFDVLVLKAHSTATAERLLRSEVRNGAPTRESAIERAIHRLDQDRRSWR